MTKRTFVSSRPFPGIQRNANCGDLTLRTKLAVLFEERRHDATRDLRRSVLLTLPGGGRCISSLARAGALDLACLTKGRGHPRNDVVANPDLLQRRDVVALAQPDCRLNERLCARVRSPCALKVAHRLRMQPARWLRPGRSAQMPQAILDAQALSTPTSHGECSPSRGACLITGRRRSFRSLVSLKPGAAARAEDAAEAPWLLRIRLLGDRHCVHIHLNR